MNFGAFSSKNSSVKPKKNRNSADFCGYLAVFAEKDLQVKRPLFPKIRNALRFVMANTRFFLDERCAKSGNPDVLKVAIAHKKRTALISLDAKIFPNQWDRKKLRVVNRLG